MEPSKAMSCTEDKDFEPLSKYGYVKIVGRTPQKRIGEGISAGYNFKALS